MTDPSELIIKNQGRPITVKEIKVDGIVNTNDQFLNSVTKALLEANTLSDVIIGSRNVANRFKKMDVFKDISVSIEACPDSKDSCIVVFKVQEAPRLYAQTGADFGSHDGSMLRNIFGNGETLSGKSSYGINTSSASLQKNQSLRMKGGDGGSLADANHGTSANELIFTKPINADPDLIFQSSIYQWDRNHISSMSFLERIRGFSARIKSFLNEDESLKYEVGYDSVWRHNHSLSAFSSMSVRRDAGHSLKSSLSHEIEFDTRNDLVFPTSGSYIKASQEFAGIGGDVSFLKTELLTQSAVRLPFGMSISGSLRGGILKPLGFTGFRPNSMINDRFHLGGPTSLRGFEPFGLGPKEKGDSLGGECYYAAGLDLMFPLPILPRSLLQGHIFANAGDLMPSASLSLDKLSNFALGAGCGLILRFTSFRLELNYCIPVRAKDSDSIKPGFQFGIGMHFM